MNWIQWVLSKFKDSKLTLKPYIYVFKNHRNIIFKVCGVRIGYYCNGIIANKIGLDLLFVPFGKSFTQRRKSKDLEMNLVEHYVLFFPSEKSMVHKQIWTWQHCSEILKKKLCRKILTKVYTRKWKKVNIYGILH